MATCLTLIDIQKGFLTPYTKKVVEVIRNIINTHREDFSYIIATRFENSATGPFVNLLHWYDLMDEVSKALDPYVESIADKIIDKNLYSCFVPEYVRYIEDNNITKIYFAGIDTDCCVLKSAADCFERNIELEVFIDACASTGGEDSDRAAITVLERLIGKERCLFGTLY